MISITNKKYIYEWDFKSYFDRLNTSYVTEKLMKYGVPFSWAQMLEIVNETPVKLACKDQLDETITRKKLEHIDNWAKEILSVEPKKSLAGVLDSLLIPSSQGGIEVGRHVYGPSEGMAQGAPTSPILSNLVGLDWVEAHKSMGYSVVMYADDSVTGSDEPINRSKLLSHMPPEARPTIAEKKSGYVKYAGQELKPLTFLGLSLVRNFIRAHSRKGSRLELSKKEMLLSELFLELHDACQTLPIKEALELFKDRYEEVEEHFNSFTVGSSTYEKIFANKLSGFIVNRLQSGN